MIQKALEGKKVRILVWSLPGDIQTFSEANLGNKPGVWFKDKVEGVTSAQVDYDYWWYEAIRGNFDDVIRRSDIYGIIYKTKKFEKLVEFTKSSNRTNLVYKNRHVAKQENNYKDKTLPEEAQRLQEHNFKDETLPKNAYKYALKYAPSHHQKTVLIDYEAPDIAVGFVLEHNMVDNYWDDSNHSLKTTLPNIGKNSPTPLQDVSSIVTGQVLWDINHNFCQSWDRQNNKQWGNDPVDIGITGKRQAFTREHYQPNPSLVDECKLVMAQIVRTYDQPNVEDIMKVYLKNIKQTTSYIYTENQYFRFPPLVREFIAYWETIKNNGRTEGPIHWFTVTNSSDEGIGKGTYTTNEMFKLLGRQDVMPGVARNVKLSELEAQLGMARKSEFRLYNERMRAPTPEGKAVANAEFEKNRQEIQKIEKEIGEIKAKQHEEQKTQEAGKAGSTKKEGELNQIESSELGQEEPNLTKELGYEISDTPGIKAHICTLMPKDEKGKYVHTYKKNGKDTPAEVYVHSKVTIMDDVFTVISSANLNTRSMQVDTELGIIMECADVAEGLRKRLWDLHTNKNSAANPDDMYDYAVAKEVFYEWEELIKANKRSQKGNGVAKCALREFYRADPSVSKSD